MKKEETNRKQPECARHSEDEEEQVLNLDELMDVQGGVEDKDTAKCGLGCYTGGWLDPTNTKDENTGNK